MAKSDSSPQEGLQQVEGYKPTRARSNAKPGNAWQVRKAAGAMTTPRGKVENLVAILFAAYSEPEQKPLDFYAPPPDPAGHTWRAFTLDTPEDEAAVVFARRYGRPPEFVFESRGNLLCGPVPEVTS